MATPRYFLAAIAAALLTASSVYAGAGEMVHVVAKGQTLGRIAKRYHTTAAAIQAANGLKPRERIHPGLELTIPERGKEPDAAKRAGGPRQSKGTAGEKHETFAKRPKRPGFVHLVRGSERFEGQLLARHGKLAPASLAGLSRILQHTASGQKTPIDPRLAAMIGLVSDHFGGRTIHVVSGYRPYKPTQYTPHSNHNFGRAMDFTVEGVPNTEVVAFCKLFRNAGVGYYPNSTFVHLDARSGRTTWVDYSKPGERPRYDSAAEQQDADETPGEVDTSGDSGSDKPQETTP